MLEILLYKCGTSAFGVLIMVNKMFIEYLYIVSSILVSKFDILGTLGIFKRY